MAIHVEIVDANSPHYDDVLRLWRANSGTLGFLPKGAFRELADGRRLLAAVDSGRVVGYLSYRVSRERAWIIHCCVDPAARGHGVARFLIDELKSITQALRGVCLTCREDFDANKLWPRLGFRSIRKLAGKSQLRSTLVVWGLDYEHVNLFSGLEVAEGLKVVIDFNVFLDIVEKRDRSSCALVQDWLQPHVSLWYTAVHREEIQRLPDATRRAQLERHLEQFKLAECTPERLSAATRELAAEALPNSKDRQRSDSRHLLHALAADADVFVTRDFDLAKRARRALRGTTLRVMKPAQLIGEMDQLQNSRDYRRADVAGTKRIEYQRVTGVESPDLVRFTRNPEQQKRLRSLVEDTLATPRDARLLRYCDQECPRDAIGFCLLTRRDSRIDVLVLRADAPSRTGTVARSMLVQVLREAASSMATEVYVTDPRLNPIEHAACEALGFLRTDSGWVKPLLFGWMTVAEASERLTPTVGPVAQLRGELSRACIDRQWAARCEHLLWPVKLADAALPNFIIPIRPRFATQLFDEEFARRQLLGVDIDLALNPESAYYRSARSKLPDGPGRVLWYVSHDPAFPGSKSIRACSRIVDVQVDDPKKLFKRFRRFGVYGWRDVQRIANKDPSQRVLAFRFDDTELLRRVRWADVKRVLKCHGIRTNLQSPVAVPAEVFRLLHAADLDPS